MGEQQIKYYHLYTESTQSKTYLDQMLEIAKRITLVEGRTQTMIPFLTTMRYSRQTSEISGILTPAICLILQGTKKLHLGQEVIDYHAGDYLVSVIDIPASAEIIGATKQSPYIGLRIDFTMEEIAAVVMEAGLYFKPRNKKLNTGAYVGTADEGLVESFYRLLKLSEKPDANPKLSNMSVSALHHKFKAVTTLGPVQYQKQLRLYEAKRLMLGGGMNVTAAAMEVGYENVSQFSREYRRLFGSSPSKDIKALKNSPGVEKIEEDRFRR